jgi:ABC-type branched-subunit amino acid transport system ATPase component
MTLKENVRFALQQRLGVSFSSWKSQRVLAQLNVRAIELLDEVGLADLSDEDAVNLPYGQKRSLEISIMLAMEPELMMLDEPAQGMGHEDVNLVAQIIKRVSVGRIILMVEHNMNVVSSIADTITVLQRGAVLSEGTYETVSRDARMMEAYMGSSSAQLQGNHWDDRRTRKKRIAGLVRQIPCAAWCRPRSTTRRSDHAIGPKRLRTHDRLASHHGPDRSAQGQHQGQRHGNDLDGSAPGCPLRHWLLTGRAGNFLKPLVLRESFAPVKIEECRSRCTWRCDVARANLCHVPKSCRAPQQSGYAAVGRRIADAGRGARLLLLDEISEVLAAVIVQAMARMIHALRDKGFTIVMVEQNFHFAAPLADRFYVMEHGQIVERFVASELEGKRNSLNELLGL